MYCIHTPIYKQNYIAANVCWRANCKFHVCAVLTAYQDRLMDSFQGLILVIAFPWNLCKMKCSVSEALAISYFATNIGWLNWAKQWDENAQWLNSRSDSVMMLDVLCRLKKALTSNMVKETLPVLKPVQYIESYALSNDCSTENQLVSIPQMMLFRNESLCRLYLMTQCDNNKGPLN